MNGSSKTSYDVIVVGAGNAAFAAALAARNAGCEVLVLEKAPKALRGGNTRFTGGIFRCVYSGLDDLVPVIGKNDDPSDIEVDPYPREAFLRDLARVTSGRNDPALSAVLVDKSYETVKWMAEQGIEFEFSRAVGAVTVPGSKKIKMQFGGALRSLHEGVGLSAGWFRIAEAAGVHIRYEAQATRILTDARGNISGVEIRGNDGLEELEAPAVVLGSGGFQANPEMRTAYLGPTWGLVKVRGTRYNTGEMTQAALGLGAQAMGHWAGCHATPIDADAPQYGDLKLTDRTNRLSYTFSVMLNLDGKRFLDEGADLNLYTYAPVWRRNFAQRGSMAFQIFDAQTSPLQEKRYETGKPEVADTLAGLVDKMHARWGIHTFDKATALAPSKRTTPQPPTSVRSIPTSSTARRRPGSIPRRPTGDAAVEAAVPSVARDRWDHVHVRRRAHRRDRARPRPRRPADPRALRDRRDDRRLLLHQLPRRVGADARRGVRQTRR